MLISRSSKRITFLTVVVRSTALVAPIGAQMIPTLWRLLRARHEAGRAVPGDVPEIRDGASVLLTTVIEVDGRLGPPAIR